MKIRGGSACPANSPMAWLNTVPQKWGHIKCSSVTTWSLYCHMYPQLVGESLPKYGSYPSYSFHNADVPLGSGKLEFHRWITELNCATCRATYVQSFWESRNETRGWENTRLQTPVHGQQLEFARLLIQLIFRSHYCISPRAERQ